VGDTVTERSTEPGVAERTKGPQTYRYSISAEATERELRLCGFALLNHYLSMHHVIAEHVRLQPVELLILVATTTGNVQRPCDPGTPGSASRQPTAATGTGRAMSRRAIARVTGIPTETVRRHVERMIRRGILVSMPEGVHAPNRLAERWSQPQYFGSLNRMRGAPNSWLRCRRSCAIAATRQVEAKVIRASAVPTT